jgi:hypothetical protein
MVPEQGKEPRRPAAPIGTCADLEPFNCVAPKLPGGHPDTLGTIRF